MSTNACLKKRRKTHREKAAEKKVNTIETVEGINFSNIIKEIESNQEELENFVKQEIDMELEHILKEITSTVEYSEESREFLIKQVQEVAEKIIIGRNLDTHVHKGGMREIEWRYWHNIIVDPGKWITDSCDTIEHMPWKINATLEEKSIHKEDKCLQNDIFKISEDMDTSLFTNSIEPLPSFNMQENNDDEDINSENEYEDNNDTFLYAPDEDIDDWFVKCDL
jgi:hypothetical protein